MVTLEATLDAPNRSTETRKFAEQCLSNIRETEDLARRLIAEVGVLPWVQSSDYKMLSPKVARVTIIVPTLPNLQYLSLIHI